jgi:hypothetical protein
MILFNRSDSDVSLRPNESQVGREFIRADDPKVPSNYIYSAFLCDLCVMHSPTPAFPSSSLKQIFVWSAPSSLWETWEFLNVDWETGIQRKDTNIATDTWAACRLCVLQNDVDTGLRLAIRDDQVDP